MQRHHQRRSPTITYEFRPNPCGSTRLLPSMSYLFLMFNSIGTIFRAYSSGQNWLLALMFIIYSNFFLLEYCFDAYKRLPQHEKSARKTLLGVAIWCLFTAIMFAFTNLFAPLFSFAAAAPLYAIAFSASAIIFYVYIIYDGDCEKCGNKCCENTSISRTNFEIIFDRV